MLLDAPYIFKQPDNHSLVSHAGFVTIKFKDRLIPNGLHERNRLISKLFAKKIYIVHYTILISMLNGVYMRCNIRIFSRMTYHINVFLYENYS